MRTGLLLLMSIFVFFVSVNSLSAQSKSKMKAAKHSMDILNYQGAIGEYNNILSKHDNAEAKINLAECYLKVSDIDNAEYWYGQVVRLPEAECKHYIIYGQLLMRNDKCDMTIEWFEKFVECAPDDIRGRHLLRACDYEEELERKNAGIYDIEHMPFNSGLDDFGPMIYGDGVVFASETHGSGISKRLHCWTGNQFLDLRYVTRDSTGKNAIDSMGMESTCGSYEYSDPENFSNQLNSKFHDATPSFSKDESTIYFTRNNLLKGRAKQDDEGIIRLKIFSAEGGGSGGNPSFNNVESLPFNSDEYSVAHPSLSPEGDYLYFASDMPGGFGGMDLYVSEQEDGRWGPPINLGPDVNTEGMEVFPYFAKDNKLYFSSDGHVGLGGLDIYNIEKKDGFNEWGDVINIGAPLNSRDDDFGYIINKENNHGYFTSDREGGFGDDDIYSFCKNATELEIYVYDEVTNEPIEGAEVVSDCKGNTVYTDEEGKATAIQRNNQCCEFTASKDTYENNSKEGCTVPGENTVVEISLKKPYECMLTGTVTQGGEPIASTPVLLTSECGDDQNTTTNDDGTYEFTLTDDCCYIVSVQPPAGFSPILEKEFCTRDDDGEIIGDCKFVKDFPFAQDLAKNNSKIDPRTGDYIDPVTGRNVPYADGVGRSSWTVEDIFTEAERNEPYDCCALIESLQTGAGEIGASPSVAYTAPGEPIPYLLHIYYDFDQSYIRDDASSELNKLLALLNENPTIEIELGSHTDSRGSNSYNTRLSQRRSEAVVRWLKDQGIAGSRLAAQGYGETMNINNCVNNVPCSEGEHQLNRRTEFRVTGLTDGTQFSSSTPRDSVDGVGCEGCPF
jgi:outer membrane protein OmpA-like peptidoglycan-associated protein/tetratricopeptide (TPR) repeat protein